MLATRVEYTSLKADGSAEDCARLCEVALEQGYFGVCVLATRVSLCCERFAGRPCRVVTVVGFPLGASLGDGKAREAALAVTAGADEIDMVWSLGDFRDGRVGRVKDEIRAVCDASQGRPVKVIIETSALSDDDKLRAAEIIVESGAAFIKTSTGFGAGGATVADIQLLRRAVGDLIGIKASGGIRSREAALALVEAGADRIGTSSVV